MKCSHGKMHPFCCMICWAKADKLQRLKYNVDFFITYTRDGMDAYMPKCRHNNHPYYCDKCLDEAEQEYGQSE